VRPDPAARTPSSLVQAALLVAVAASRVAQPSRSDTAGALYSTGAAWTIEAERPPIAHCQPLVYSE
jgi:hypothetical protein